MPYYFYLARCSDNSLYCGCCKDLKSREAMHNSGKGAKYTRSRLPIQVVYHEEFTTLADAMKREAHVKKWSKTQKEDLVSEAHPTKN